MIIVTGTKRSGTSMWMRLLQAAGFADIGSAFPLNWGNTIRDANPDGFHESILRDGIYYKTNPHPKTGAYLFPEATRRHAVKVFLPGLVRSDRAFLDHVIASMRPWREYVASLDRLVAMEREANKEKRPDWKPAVRMPPALEWWSENFSFVSDVLTRQYPTYSVAYENVLRDPEAVLTEIFEWLGDGDVAAAAALVDADLRTQDERLLPAEHDLDADITAIFDELYDHIAQRKAIEPEFVDRLNETNEKLAPQIYEATRAVEEDRLQRRRRFAEQARSTSTS